MSKKLLSEAQIRRFAKLANLSPINEMYHDKRDDKEEMEEGYGMSHNRDDNEVMEEEAEEEVAMDAEKEMDDLPMPEEEEIEMDADGDNEGLASDVLSAVAGALEAALGVNIEIDGADDEVEMSMDDDAPMDDEMPMDDEAPMDDEMPMEEGVEDIMEALKGVNYIPDNKEVVNEVARRVAKRLLKAQKAQKNLDEALGSKRTR